MRPSFRSVIAVAVSLVLIGPDHDRLTAADEHVQTAPLRAACLPAAFVQLGGSEDPRQGFASFGTGAKVHVETGSIVIQCGPAPLRMHLEGAEDVRPRGALPGAARIHRFAGADPATWLREVPTFGAIAFDEIADGVALVLHAGRGVLEYDLLVAPGGSLDSVVLRLEGATAIESRGGGSLELSTPNGSSIVQRRPESFAIDKNGRRTAVAAGFRRLVGGDRIGFRCAAPPGSAIVIDPVLEFASYAGGGGDDRGLALDVADDGAIYFAGVSDSLSFDGAGAEKPQGSYDVFVARVSPQGDALESVAFVGGSATEYLSGFFGPPVGVSVRVDDGGTVHLAGSTLSSDFPVTPDAFDGSHNGGLDAFVVELSSDLSVIHYGTYLGGLLDEVVRSLDVSAQGDVLIAGETTSLDFPTTIGSFDPQYNGGFLTGDVFCAKLNGAGSALVYSGFVGGLYEERLGSAFLSKSGEVVLAGSTQSFDFPVTPGAFASGPASFDGEGFVARIDAAGQQLIASTLIGGSGFDHVEGIALDALGRIVIGGETDSPDFPASAGTLGPAPLGLLDGFVARLSADLSTLSFATFVGGTQDDSIADVGVDGAGRLVIAGTTRSPDFPSTLDSVTPVPQSPSDANGFLSLLSADASSLVHGSVLGGSANEVLSAMQITPGAVVRLVGATESADLPMLGASFGLSHHGPAGHDAFLLGVNLCPGGFSSTGVGCAPASGLVPTLEGTGCPAAGFVVVLSLRDAPARAPGLLLASSQSGVLPLTASCSLGVGPLTMIAPFLTKAAPDGSGYLDIEVLLRNPLPGVHHLQAVVLAPGGSLAATAPLLMTLP